MDRTDPTRGGLAPSWPSPASGDQCFGNNTTWASAAQPWLVYLKLGCPTAYTYPFDDATSTFQCQSPSGGEESLNLQDYTITLRTLAAPAETPTPGPTGSTVPARPASS